MPKQDEKDVKNLEEESKVDDSEETEEKEETSEEESTEPEEKTEEETKEETKKEEEKTSTDSSPEKKKESESEGIEPLKDGIVETPRERGLRLKIERMQGDTRKERSKELFVSSDAPAEKKEESSPDKSDKLKKYDSKEIENLREVMGIIGEDLGYIKKDEYQKSSYEDAAKGILDDFLEAHQEYNPENDKGDVLWGRFQSEFKQYKNPSSPHDLKKLFKKIHNDVVGIKPASDLLKIEAKKEKIESVSHSASKSKSKTKPNQTVNKTHSIDKETAKAGLKGFTDEEIDELIG